MGGFVQGFKKGTETFGHSIITLVNCILLLFVYIFGVGLTSIVAKIVGKKFLEPEIKGKSYWSDLKLKKKKIDEYYRQF